MKVGESTRRVVTAGGIVICAVVFGSPGCQDVDRTGNNEAQKVSVADVIKANSDVIDELGRAASVMTQCSDIVMRYSHFTDHHSETVLLCPECSKGRPKHQEPEIEEPDEDIPETMAQLLSDSQELRTSVGSLTSSLLLQRVALQHHLEKLRAEEGALR